MVRAIIFILNIHLIVLAIARTHFILAKVEHFSISYFGTLKEPIDLEEQYHLMRYIVNVVEYGTSLEGRPLNTMVIGKGSRKMILHGGTHAREWINPIEMINFSKQLGKLFLKIR